MIEVSCIVKIYDQEPKEEDLLVHNHWNRSEMVVIEVGGRRYTVSANDMKAAIDNCKNINRFL